MHPSHRPILTIMKKELRRSLCDRRMLISLILPGLLIYLLYTIMGSAMSSLASEADTPTYTICVERLPVSLSEFFTSSDSPFELVEMPADRDAAIRDGQLDLHIAFPDEFDESVANYTPATGAAAPEVRIFYNSTVADSQNAFSLVLSMLDTYESSMANQFDINRSTDTTFDLSTEEDSVRTMFSMLLPMLLITLLFSGCMTIAPESIAGEKERGTLATLLVTPTRRSELAIGKMAALSIVALISGAAGFIGTLFALPHLMGKDAGKVLTADLYGIGELLSILAIILCTTLLFIALISVISAFARSVKEAVSFATPLMILVMILSLSNLFLTQDRGHLALFLIPVYNSVCCMGDIFSHSWTLSRVLLTVGSNLTIAGLFVPLLTRMFNSEKIMFRR